MDFINRLWKKAWGNANIKPVIILITAFLVFLAVHAIWRPPHESASVQYASDTSYDVAAKSHWSTTPYSLYFSHPGGLYTQPFYLELGTVYLNAYIFFTLDGSEPTPENALLFTSPIHIANRTPEENVLSAIPAYRIGCFIVYRQDYFVPPVDPVFKATVIRARVFDSNWEPLTDIITHSYFVSEDIFTRYYGLPIISIVTDAANFFDDEIGIYVRGHNNQGGHGPGEPMPNWQQRGREWERPIHLELFEAYPLDFERVISMNMGVRIHGGGSRRLAQKSLRLYPRAYYDPQQANIRYDIFQGRAINIDGEPIVQFGRLILRNFGNEGTGSMFRDAGLQYLSRYLHVGIQASRPAVVFLNGEFWGLYNIRERFDDRYIASHFHINRDYVAMLSMSPRGLEVDVGSRQDRDDFRILEDFFRANSMECNDNFATAKSYIDIYSFIDAYIANIFFGNIDWPGNNATFWRYNGTPNPYQPGRCGRWHWLLSDLDSTAGFTFGFDYWDDTLRRLLVIPEEREPMPGDSVATPRSTLIFRGLMENADFRSRFVNRFTDIMNTYFRQEPFWEMIDTFSDKIRPAVPEQIQRWGRINSMNDWEQDLETLRTFAGHRHRYMMYFLQTNLHLSSPAGLTTVVDESMGRITVNGIDIDPELTPGVRSAGIWSGAYFIGTEQIIHATPLYGYAFARFIVEGPEGAREYVTNPLAVKLDGDTVVRVVFYGGGMGV